MKNGLLLLVLICLNFSSCEDITIEKEDNFHFKNEMEATINSFEELTDNEKKILTAETKNLLDASNFIIAKIANSNIDVGSLTEENIIKYGVFTSKELNDKLTVINQSQGNIKKVLKARKCIDCNYDEETKKNKLKELVENYRFSPSSFESFKESFLPGNEISLVAEEEPNCSFAFYACIGICSTASSGLLAAACVYLCACSYCETTPPGC